MNTFQSLNTEYLSPSRTIDTILVSNNKQERVLFIYNYEGYSFRVFSSHLGLINFFMNQAESDFHFETEVELDNFLYKVQIII